MDTQETTLIGQLTPEQIAELKKKYREVFQVTVDGKIGFLRKPDRHVMAYASTVLQESPYAYAEQIVRECWLGGDAALMEDDDLFMGVLSVVNELVQIKAATLVKV